MHSLVSSIRPDRADRECVSREALMLRALVSILLLLSLARPAAAAIQFLGHGANAAGCVSRLDWSSDLGPPYVATRPFASLVNGYDVSSDTSRSLPGGSASAYARVWVAPAGPASFSSGPVLRFECSGSASSNGDLYGRFATASHSACLKFVAPGPGATVHWGVRWSRVRNLTGRGNSATTLMSPFGPILPGAGGADSGMVFGTQVGTVSQLCSFDMSQDWSLSSIDAGTASGSFNVEVYLDDAAPILGAEASGGSSGRFELAATRPNPSRGPSSLEFELPSSGRVTLRILDVAGRVVRDVEPGVLPAGRNVVQWDGLASSGEHLAAGIYFARLEFAAAGGPVQSRGRRMVIVE